MSLFLGLIGSVQEANATHLMGSDIDYRCLGNGKYEINVRVYRDCNGIPLSQSPIVLSCSSTTLNITNQTKVSVRDITGIDPNCPTQSRCQNQWIYGIEEHVFRAEVDLSAYSCCEWTISWAQSARNSNISTGPANQNFYTFAQLNKCVTPCNSSPQFTNPPVAIVCHNQDFVFNNGALDTLDSGDSLSYSLAPGFQNKGQQVTYNSPYTYTRPMCFWGQPNSNLTWPAGFHLDPLTGDLKFRPTCLNQIGIVVIEVKEWRMVNGVMTVVGITRRDMQIIVISCPNNKVPKIQQPYSTQACAGQQACLTITTTDDDQGDTVKITWNKGIKGATFTNNNGQVKFASGQVCWTPTEADISNIPYTFTITARDNSCNPFPGQSIRAFSIFVRETPKAELSAKVLTCGRVAIHHTNPKNYGGYSFNYEIRNSNNKPVWSGTETTDTAQLQPGWHRLILTMRTSTPCFNVEEDSIFIPDYVKVTLPQDTFVCNGLPINLISQTSGGDAPYVYEWARLTDSGVSDVLSTNDSRVVDNDSAETYLIRVLDANGCRNYDTVQVAWFERPMFNLGPDPRICYGTSYTIEADKDSSHRFLWSTGATSKGIDVYDSNMYWVKVTDTIGCWYSDTLNLFVNKPQPYAGYDRAICQFDTLHLSASGGDSYQWFKKEGFVFAPLPTPIATGKDFHYPITKSQGFILRVTQTYQGVTCVAYDSMEVNMNALPEITLQTPAALCLNTTPLSLASLVQYPTLFNGDWRSDNMPNAVANGFFYPSEAGVNANPGHAVIYRVVDQNGCKNEKAVPIKVNALPVIELSTGTEVCGDAGILALNTLKDKPNQGQTNQGVPEWFSLDGNPLVNAAIDKTQVHNQKLDISQLPQGITYGLVFRYSDNTTKCINEDTTYVRVKKVPQANAGTLAPLCWNDPLLDLNGAAKPSPSGGTWTSLDMPMQGSTTILPADIGVAGKFKAAGTVVRFVYTVVEDGCSKSDTLITRIKGIPDLILTPFDGWCENAGLVNLSNKTNIQGGTWSGKGVSGTNFDPKVAGVAGSHVLRYSYTNPTTQCSVEDQFSIEVQAEPGIELLTSGKSCEGEAYALEIKLSNAGSALIQSSGDGDFEAPGSGLKSTTLLLSNYYPGTIDRYNLNFTLTAQTTNNRYCAAASTSQRVEIFPLPTASIEATPVKGCDPLPVHLKAISDASPGATYIWDFGNGKTLSGNDEVKELDEVFEGPGIYQVNLRVISREEEGSCEQSAGSVAIEVLPTPVADFSVNRWETTVALPGIQFTDLSTVAAPASLMEWHWTFGDRNQSISNLQHPYFEYPVDQESDTGTYQVSLRVVADNLCEDYDSGEIHIGPDITVFIPNAFTPNQFGIGKNERFFVIADGFETFQIQIFNRWGEKLYESTDILEGWDGNYRGKEAQQDVYIYVVKVTSLAGKAYEYYGTITLLR